MTYKIEISGDTMRVAFGDPAQNDRIVQDAVARLAELDRAGLLTGGPLLKINGPASLPVAFVICHAVAHRYETVAVYDPKLGKYVVSISHGAHFVGELID